MAISDLGYSVAELMITHMARTLAGLEGERVVGSATPCSHLAGALAQRLNPNLVLMHSYTLFDGTCPPSITAWEWLVRGSIRAELDQETMFDLVLNGDFAIWIGPPQVDRHGNANTSVIGPWERPKVCLVGARGLPDDSVNLPEMLYYIPKHNPRSLVDQVDFVSAVGYGPARRRGEISWGSPLLVITNLGVFDFADNGDGDTTMRIRSLHSGVSLEQVQKATGFALQVPQTVRETEAPASEELRLIREELDPLGCRDLEFLSGEAAAQRTADVLNKEDELVNDAKLSGGRR